MTEASDRIAIHVRGEDKFPYQSIVMQLCLDRQLVFTGYRGWQSDERPPLDGLPGQIIAEHVYGDSGHRYTLFEQNDGSLVSLEYATTGYGCLTYAKDTERGQELITEFSDKIPRSKPKQNTVPVTFWAASKDGPQGHHRSIAVPPWTDIAGNYNASTRQQLEQVYAIERPTESGGKLMLWHGEPGTGKTYAIRALLGQWRGWAAAHYILDPEEFFGRSPLYMMRVALSLHETDWFPLLILEDAGELLGKDAKAQSGQGLSRLLNLCDGLVGQGVRLLVLITTNEELGSLHSAVTRAGRCLSNVSFNRFTGEEASAWAERNGTRAEGRRLLADLYSTTQARREPVRRVGFQPT